MSCRKLPACFQTLIILGILSYGIAMVTINFAEYLNQDAKQSSIKVQQSRISCPDLCGPDYITKLDSFTCCTADWTCCQREYCKMLRLTEMDGIKNEAAQQVLLFSIIVVLVFICLIKIKCQPCRQLCMKEQQVAVQQRVVRDSTLLDPFVWEDNRAEEKKGEEDVEDALKGSFYILNNPENCAVCLQKLEEDKVIRLGCKHLFHGGCIREWIAKSNSCPVCRKPN